MHASIGDVEKSAEFFIIVATLTAKTIGALSILSLP
jgi:hypothetical protein